MFQLDLVEVWNDKLQVQSRTNRGDKPKNNKQQFNEKLNHLHPYFFSYHTENWICTWRIFIELPSKPTLNSSHIFRGTELLHITRFLGLRRHFTAMRTVAPLPTIVWGKLLPPHWGSPFNCLSLTSVCRFIFVTQIFETVQIIFVHSA
jgi:hypothetical protein